MLVRVTIRREEVRSTKETGTYLGRYGRMHLWKVGMKESLKSPTSQEIMDSKKRTKQMVTVSHMTLIWLAIQKVHDQRI